MRVPPKPANVTAVSSTHPTCQEGGCGGVHFFNWHLPLSFHALSSQPNSSFHLPSLRKIHSSATQIKKREKSHMRNNDTCIILQGKKNKTSVLTKAQARKRTEVRKIIVNHVWGQLDGQMEETGRKNVGKAGREEREKNLLKNQRENGVEKRRWKSCVFLVAFPSGPPFSEG